MAAAKIQDKNCLQSTVRKKKINALFAGLGRSVLRKTVPSVFKYDPRPAASSRTQDLWHSFSQYGPPRRQIYVFIIYLIFLINNYFMFINA